MGRAGKEPVVEEEVPEEAQQQGLPRLPAEPFPTRGTREWGEYEDIVLQHMGNVVVPPSSLAHQETLTKLGLKDDVAALFANMGLGTLCFIDESSYPEVAKEFLASVQLSYADPDEPDVHSAELSFIIRRKWYMIKVSTLNSLFGFSDGRLRYFYWSQAIEPLISIIASVDRCNKSTKETSIRNPVVRYAARLIGSLFYGATDAASVTQPMLCHLHVGVRSLLPPEMRDLLRPANEYNFGIMLAKELVGYRRVSSHGRERTCGFGAVITKILRKAKVRLHSESKSLDRTTHQDRRYIDLKSLVARRFLAGPYSALPENGPYLYKFQINKERLAYFKLPQTEQTTLLSLAALRFQPARTEPRPSTSITERQGGPPPQAATSSTLPDDFSEYLLPEPPSPDAPIAHHLAYLGESVRKNNAMHQRMWRAIVHLGRCLSPRTASSPPRRAPSPPITAAADDDEDLDESSPERPLELRKKARHDGSSSSHRQD